MQGNPPKLPTGFLDAAVELMGRSGRGGTVLVRGRSMLPTLREGQTLAVDFAPAGRRRGDVLLFRQHGDLLVHRFLGTGRPRDGRQVLRTRGDGVPTLDPAVDPERVVGRVTAVLADSRWRSMESGAARRYAWCLAWHDRCWGILGFVARKIDSKLRWHGLPAPLLGSVAAVDRLLLSIVHAILFRRVHPVIERPPEAGTEPGTD